MYLCMYVCRYYVAGIVLSLTTTHEFVRILALSGQDDMDRVVADPGFVSPAARNKG